MKMIIPLEGHEDYREMMETLIKQRRKLCPIRLEMSEGLEELEILMLMNFLNLKKHQIYISSAPLDLKFINEFKRTFEIYAPRNVL